MKIPKLKLVLAVVAILHIMFMWQYNFSPFAICATIMSLLFFFFFLLCPYKAMTLHSAYSQYIQVSLLLNAFAFKPMLI